MKEVEDPYISQRDVHLLDVVHRSDTLSHYHDESTGTDVFTMSQA